MPSRSRYLRFINQTNLPELIILLPLMFDSHHGGCEENGSGKTRNLRRQNWTKMTGYVFILVRGEKTQLASSFFFTPKPCNYCFGGHFFLLRFLLVFIKTKASLGEIESGSQRTRYIEECKRKV